MYLEAYSRKEKLKFEGIVEQLQQANGEEKEDTKAKLVDFMQNILGIDDDHEIEFQRVHRMGRSLKEGVAGRPIIATFLDTPTEKESSNGLASLRTQPSKCMKIFLEIYKT